MDKPVLKRIRMSQPYYVNPKNNKMFSFYCVMVIYPDGTRKTYDSEEHAMAAIEGREFDKRKLESEVPEGYADK